jgi:hypothetical protein
MTKSKLVGRGGARAGSGRKKKPVAGPTRVVSEIGTQSAPISGPIIPTGLSAEDLKQFCETLAYETLATVAVTGTSESARVAASRELLDRSLGKPKPAPATKPDQSDFFEDGWGDLLKSRQPASGRTN